MIGLFPFQQIVREINAKSHADDNDETEEELQGSLDQRTENNDDDSTCKRCPILEQKIIYYQKKISWLRKSKNELKDRLNKVNTVQYSMYLYIFSLGCTLHCFS